jgi:hypothetical protein
MMKITFIKSAAGPAFGIKHQYPDGRVEVRTKAGKLLGWYDPASDRTVKPSYGFVGEGDQTMGLLYDAL